MSEIYIIVYCGYERIENVLWGTTDREEAVVKMQKIKSVVENFEKRLEMECSVSPDEGYLEQIERQNEWWRKIEIEGENALESLGIRRVEDIVPSRYCVMSFKEGDSCFKCCCRELGFGLKEPFLMG